MRGRRFGRLPNFTRTRNKRGEYERATRGHPEAEIIYCTKYSDPYPHLAGIFAAKESVIKCLNKPTKMIEIEIIHGRYGKPIALIHRKRKNTITTQISISHTKSLAIAVAITD
jgi:phosphopantetheine--protein transferase-like protein